MIDYSEAKLFLERLPWPTPGMRPLLQFGHDGGRAIVRLYNAKQTCVITARGREGLSQEAVLRHALGLWIGPKPGFALAGDARAAFEKRLRELMN